MKLNFQFPGCDTPRRLFDQPIIDPVMQNRGSEEIGRGITWKRGGMFGSPGKTIHWEGNFEAVIQDQDVALCGPSILTLERRRWNPSLGQLTLAEFIFAAEFVLGLEKIEERIFKSIAREIGFPVTIFNPAPGINENVIIVLQDLEREGGHYLPWQMETNATHEWIVYRKPA